MHEGRGLLAEKLSHSSDLRVPVNAIPGNPEAIP